MVEEINRVELTNDNRTLYINGVKVVGIERCDIDISDRNVLISFPAEIGVFENFKK